MDPVLELDAEARGGPKGQATEGEGLAQGSYMAARVGLKTLTLQMKGGESTNKLPRLMALSS